MLSRKSAVYLAPAIAKRVVQFGNNGDASPNCTVENLDPLASCAVRYQESDDGQNWNDIANTTATVNPGQVNVQAVQSIRRLIALFAGGNVEVTFAVDRTVNGAPTDLGVA